MPEIVPTRRSVIRTAAWSVPVVAVAGAAPAFATTPPTVAPNLSESNAQSPIVQGFSGNRVLVGPPQFVNSGDAAADGLRMTINSSEVISNYQFHLPFGPPGVGAPIPPADHDIIVTGLGTKTLSVAIPLPFFGYGLAAKDGADNSTMTMFVRQIFTFVGTVTPTSLDYTVEATNGGIDGSFTVAIPGAR